MNLRLQGSQLRPPSPPADHGSDAGTTIDVGQRLSRSSIRSEKKGSGVTCSIPGRPPNMQE
jgi:hypothetical protein